MRPTIIRTTHLRDVAQEWALVLTAAGIESRVDDVGGALRLSVDAEVAEQAQNALQGYDAERGARDELAGTRPWDDDAGSAWFAWLVGAAILVGFALTGANSSHSFWYAAGAARASAIRDGELWRCVTALTLHADLLHALSNTVSGLLFLVPLSRLVGGGTALLMTLAAGAVATWVNVTIRTPGYSGIGASTAVFATLGSLAALRVAGAQEQRGWRRYRPAAAAVAVLAMLGASPSTDVIAHLLGLLVGFALGLVFTSVRSRRVPSSVDPWLGSAAVAIIVLSWRIAITTG